MIWEKTSEEYFFDILYLYNIHSLRQRTFSKNFDAGLPALQKEPRVQRLGREFNPLAPVI